MRIPTWMSVALASLLMAAPAARGESPSKPSAPALIVTHHRSFRIPFAPPVATGDGAGEIAMFVSTDEGKTWEMASKVSPAAGSFRFSAPKDGTYWFAVNSARQGEEPETKFSPSIKVKVETGDQGEDAAPKPAPTPELNDQLEEARLGVELLQFELSAEKTQLKQHLQMLKQIDFVLIGRGGMGMMGGGPGGGFGGAAPDSEQRKKALAASRERYDELKAAVLETSKKLSRARQRLAEIEGRVERSTSSDGPLPGKRSSLAEQRARLTLLELEFDVDRALLRDAMLQFGKVELERSSAPVKSDGAEAAAKWLERLREYVELKKVALVKRGIELNIQKQQLAETEERLKESN
jgi:hypothetical protein